jgi:hypothetical protein
MEFLKDWTRFEITCSVWLNPSRTSLKSPKSLSKTGNRTKKSGTTGYWIEMRANVQPMDLNKCVNPDIDAT